MQLDVILDARADAHALAELGVLAEAHGFGGVWVSSLLDGRDPFANMSVLAQQTERIHMGPIAVNPWESHPVRISGSLHTLNELSNGRARIVIGGGGEALASLGLKPERRVRAVQECVEILRLAGKGQRFDYAGSLYQAKDYGLGWLDAPPPKVYVGANMEQMLRMAGRVADGVMLSDLPPPLARDALATARAAAEEKQRAPDSLWYGSFTAWHVYASADEARREARRWLLLRGLFRPWVLETFCDPDEIALVMRSGGAFVKAFREGNEHIEGIPDALADKLVDHLALVGSTDAPDDLVQRLRRYRESGIDAVCLRLYQHPAQSMEWLAAHVLPALRD